MHVWSHGEGWNRGSLEGVGKLHFLWMIKDGACHAVTWCLSRLLNLFVMNLLSYFLVSCPVVTYCGTGTMVKLFPSQFLSLFISLCDLWVVALFGYFGEPNRPNRNFRVIRVRFLQFFQKLRFSKFRTRNSRNPNRPNRTTRIDRTPRPTWEGEKPRMASWGVRSCRGQVQSWEWKQIRVRDHPKVTWSYEYPWRKGNHAYDSI